VATEFSVKFTFEHFVMNKWSVFSVPDKIRWILSTQSHKLYEYNTSSEDPVLGLKTLIFILHK
jgi:hypothetical protein